MCKITQDSVTNKYTQMKNKGKRPPPYTNSSCTIEHRTTQVVWNREIFSHTADESNKWPGVLPEFEFRRYAGGRAEHLLQEGKNIQQQRDSPVYLKICPVLERNVFTQVNVLELYSHHVLSCLLTFFLTHVFSTQRYIVQLGKNNSQQGTSLADTSET